MLQRQNRRAIPPARVYLIALLVAILCTFARAQPVAVPDALRAANLTPAEQQFLREHPVLRVAYPRLDFMPFQAVGHDGRAIGTNVAVLQSLTDAIGMSIEPVWVDDWPAALDALRTRRADAIAYLGHAVEREAYADFSLGVAPDPTALIALAGTVRAPASSDSFLAGRRVAVGTHSIGQGWLERNHPRAIAVPVIDVETGLRALIEGRADFFLNEWRNVQSIAPRLEPARFEIERQVFFGSGWSHFAIRSDWPVLSGLLNRLLGARDQPQAANGAAGAAVPVAPLAMSDQEQALLAERGVLRVGAVRGLRLLNDVAAGGEHTGVAADFTAYLSHKLGIATRTVAFGSVAEMVDAARQGRIDLIPFFSPTPQRRQEFRFSRPYLSMPYLLLSRVDDILYWDLRSLEGASLALAREHPLLPVVREQYPSITVVEVDDGRAALDAVASGRVSAAVEVKLFAHEQIATHHAGRLRMVAQVAELPAEFAFAAPIGQRGLIDLVDRALAEMPEVERARMERRWVAIDLEPARRINELLSMLGPVMLTIVAFLAATAFWRHRLALSIRNRRMLEQRLLDVTDRLRTGVFELQQSPDGRVSHLFTNRMVQQLIGPREREPCLDVQGLLSWIDPQEIDRVAERVRHSFATGADFRESFRFRGANRERGWIVAEASAREGPGDARTWSGYLFDLTSERILTEQLDLALQARNEFIAMLGHELRTPVGHAGLALQSVSAAGLPSSAAEALARAQDAVRLLDELLADLMDLAQADARRLLIRVRPVGVRPFIEGVARAFEPSLRAAGLRFEWHVDSTVPETLRLDPVRLRQVLYNLLENARKYTRDGAVSLAVTVHDHRSDAPPTEPLLRIEVQDSGIGIPADELERVFEPFRRVGPHDRSGVGLGLAVSQRIAAAMGGEIAVRSAPGEGSTFVLTLPLDKASEEGSDDDSGIPALRAHALLASSSDTREAGSGAVEGAGLLLVDDDRLVRAMLGELLRQAGFEVREAESAEEALRFASEDPPAVILTDYRMTGMNGIEFARTIREQRRQAGAPAPIILALSGGMPAEISALSAGVFDAILLKPTTAGEVEAAIEEARRMRA